MTQPLASWLERAQPAADILNPAISAVCIAWCAARYTLDTHTHLPFELAFLTVPITLHAPTRAVLPKSRATHLAAWVGRNTSVLAAFPARATAFAPYVREGLRYGVRSGLLQLGDDGRISATIRDIKSIPEDSDLRDIATSAARTGDLFARSGTTANIFALFGVSP